MNENQNKPASHRTLRVADLIREEIAKYLISGVKDPRIGFVTITNVKMTPDLQTARVQYTAYGSRNEQIETTNGLNESTKEIRKHLASVLKLRYTPRLEFFVDEGLEHSYHINKLLGQISKPQVASATSAEAEADVDADTDPVAATDDE